MLHLQVLQQRIFIAEKHDFAMQPRWTAAVGNLRLTRARGSTLETCIKAPGIGFSRPLSTSSLSPSPLLYLPLLNDQSPGCGQSQGHHR